MPTAVLVATLLKVSKNPSPFFKRELPAACRMGDRVRLSARRRAPGTHWRDVWGDQVSSVPGEVEQPTEGEYCEGSTRRPRNYTGNKKAGPELQCR